MNLDAISPPILSCEDARALETARLGGDEAKEWSALQRAGRAIAAAVLRDFDELGGFPGGGKILVLAGKGHNGGDALIAAQTILETFPRARAEVSFTFGDRTLRPLARRAWRALQHAGGDRVVRVAAGVLGCRYGYDLCLDGVFGFQFRPPADANTTEYLNTVNALPIGLRAAVDLPSAGLFRADFTYATGSVKTPVVGAPEAGRVRFLDLGFFDGNEAGTDRVLTTAVLAPLARLRPAHGDKRSYGHVCVVGGSRRFPGAILMTVLAALRSGAGLVTAFVPESVAAAFAARAPEAMWVGWPETPSGSLALEGEHLLRGPLERATALVLGPGMGREEETLALVTSIVKASKLPTVIDADALQPGIVAAGSAPRIATPHAGEFARIQDALGSIANATLVLKGAVTRVSRSAGILPAHPKPKRGKVARATTYHSFFGGPVLARGGSGDLLAGLIGGLLAQNASDPLLAAARGVVWHGLAADLLARTHGQVAVSVTRLLEFLPAALRSSVERSPEDHS